MRRVLPPAVSEVKNCPRCDHYIPSDDNPGAYPGALSRTDNKTEICSPCGQAESIEEFLTEIMPQSEWVKNKKVRSLIHFSGDVLDMQRAEMREEQPWA